MGGIVVTIFWFLVVLTPLVFVHEFGHYWFARRAGVRVEVFSVGFGRELFGYTDKAGTRWKFSLIPFGGYVKMFGQSDLGPDDEGADMTDAERAVAFHHKKLSQKTAIVAAGPLANILFAITIFTVLFATTGQPFTPAQVSEVVPGSAAEVAGLKSGDEFLEVAGRSIARFEEVQQLIRLHPGIPVDIIVDRDGAQLNLVATPSVNVIPDGLGDEARIGVLGVRGLERAFERHAAFLSINLGLINLLPIPLLDGGHLAFYAYEAVFRRAPGRWAQELGMKIGLVFVLGLMLFATFNDIVRLPVVQRLVSLFT